MKENLEGGDRVFLPDTHQLYRELQELSTHEERYELVKEKITSEKMLDDYINLLQLGGPTMVIFGWERGVVLDYLNRYKRELEKASLKDAADQYEALGIHNNLGQVRRSTWGKIKSIFDK